MGEFATRIRIDAPVSRVWDELDDIGSIAKWNPGVVESYATGDAERGLGATRHCDLGGPNFLDEKVVDWAPEQRITMRVVDTNLPFESVDIRFTLEPSGSGTVVTCSPIYRLKYGLLGEIMDRFYVRRTYREGMDSLLQGLKEHVEGAA